MENEEPRQQSEKIENPHEAKEERHINSRLVPYSLLHQCSIYTVQKGAGEGEGIADGELCVGFVGEGASIFVVIAGEIYCGYQDNAGERGKGANQLPCGKSLNAEEGAEDQRPNA